MTFGHPRPQDFTWAHELGANLREPIHGLKEKGWQYGDIPTASNFNWLFNELGKWDKYLDGRIDQAYNDLNQRLDQANKELENKMQEFSSTVKEKYREMAKRISTVDENLRETRRDLKMTVEVLQSLIDKVLTHNPRPPLNNPTLPDIRMAVSEANISVADDEFANPVSAV